VKLLPLCGHLHGDRYYAKLNDHVGVCVYTVGSVENYLAQLFPLPFPGAGLHECFVQFTMALARNDGPETRELRSQYRYLEAPDVLTLRCLLHEAEDNWRECNVDDRDAGPEAGEGVE